MPVDSVADVVAVPERTRDGCSAAAEVLARVGVDVVFTLAGSDVGGIAQEASRRGIRVVACRDERSAAFMAAAHGAVTRFPGVCLVTQGPGLTNALTGLLQAQKGGWPLVSISGSAPRADAGRGPLQELDQVALVRPAARWAEVVPSAERLPDLLERAFQTALRPPRGHAHLSIPGDVLAGPAPVAAPRDPETYLSPAAPEPDPASVRRALELVESAERPILLVGPGAWFADAGAALAELLDKLALPTFTFDEARGLVSDLDPLCLGSLLFRLNGAAPLVAEADVVVTLGLEPDWRVEHLAPPLLGGQAALVQIDSRAEDLARTGPAAVALFADEARAAAALARSARRRAWPEWLDRLRTARQRWLLDLAQAEGEVDGAVHPCALARAVADAASRRDAQVVIDGGHVGKWAKALVRAERPGRVWRLKGALAAIGHGLPSAIALALSDPTRPTLLITGDGSFGYGFLELETAVAERLPITCVVAADGAWGSVYTSQLAAHGGSVGTRLSRTPFDELARALGAHGERVTEARALDDALERALAYGGPAVLAVDSATVPSPAVYPRTSRYA